jgi:hypothetical protein
MRALTTTIAPPGSTNLPATRAMAPAPRRARSWGRLFHRRREATLFQRCLAVHMATAETFSALR